MRAQSYLIYAREGFLRLIVKGRERWFSGTIVATHKNKGKRYPYSSSRQVPVLRHQRKVTFFDDVAA